jgi:hypothetical protein
VAVTDPDGRSWIVDAAHDAVPLAADANPWPLLAVTGGRPAQLFGELEDDAFHPATVAIDGALVSL